MTTNMPCADHQTQQPPSAAVQSWAAWRRDFARAWKDAWSLIVTFGPVLCLLFLVTAALAVAKYVKSIDSKLAQVVEAANGSKEKPSMQIPKEQAKDQNMSRFQDARGSAAAVPCCCPCCARSAKKVED